MSVLAPHLEEKVADLHTQLAQIVTRYSPALFTTSFGAEDMVLVDAIARHFPQIGIATLDTGRLPEQTYDVWRRAEERYRCRIAPFVPVSAPLEHYIRVNGVNGFRDSVTQRMQCCDIRKVEPLARALAGKAAWITGQRREQSRSRAGLARVEFDALHGLSKFNPLVEWSEDEVWDYIATRDVPYNALHDQGYPSIGCAPCTRAVAPGEDFRAGRWWWEAGAAKECGLHANTVVVNA
jgi:phosphoadenosine phosphosulfate reductase